jgi:hypothetical protein
VEELVAFSNELLVKVFAVLGMKGKERNGGHKDSSRFPEGMTARKARAMANSDTGVSPLRCAPVEMTEWTGRVG